MRFAVTRTSRSRDTAPCEGAVEGTLDGAPTWFVEIWSLGALMAFQAKHGRLIVSTAFDSADTPAIESPAPSRTETR